MGADTMLSKQYSDESLRDEQSPKKTVLKRLGSGSMLITGYNISWHNFYRTKDGYGRKQNKNKNKNKCWK